MAAIEIKPILIILPDSHIENTTKKVLSDNPKIARWCQVCVADSVAAIPLAKNAVRQGAKAIVSRGGTAILLREIFQRIQVVEIKPNIPLIILRYFDLVRKYGEGNVLLLASRSFLPSMLEQEDLAKHGYKLQVFEDYSSEPNIKKNEYCLGMQDLTTYLKDCIKRTQSSIFVLGDASACTVADELGIANEIIPSSESEILTAIQEAISSIRKVFIGQAMTLPEVEIVIEKAVKPVLLEFGFEVLTQMDRYRPGVITKEILEELEVSSLIIIDVTGERQNCYYEIGYAKGLNKPVLMTAKAGTKLHFDIVSDRCLFWKSWEELDTKLRHAFVEMGYKEFKVQKSSESSLKD